MNDANAQQGYNTLLRGPALIAARVAWVAVVAAGLGLTVLAIPGEYQLQMEAAFGLYGDSLRQLGIPPEWYAFYRTALQVNFIVAFTAISAGIFLHRSDDWMVIAVSLAGITFALLFVTMLVPLGARQPEFALPVVLLRGIGLSSSLIVYYFLLPDGRFVPKRARILALLWLGLVVVWCLAPEVPANLIHASTWSRTLPLALTIYALFFGSGVVAQVYRYRRYSSPTQRQQTKWVVLGTSTAVTGFMLFYLPVTLFPELNRSGSVADLLYWTIGLPIYHLLVLTAPVSIGLSILRYHLWRVDVIINRALVYSTLTVCLAIVYFGSIVVLHSLLAGLWGSSYDLAVAASTLAIAATFNPLRRRIKHTIDRQFFRDQYEIARMLAVFGISARREVDVDTLSSRLIEVVDKAMQSTQTSLWLFSVPLPTREEGQATPSTRSRSDVSEGEPVALGKQLSV